MKKTLLLSVVASTMIMAGGDIAPVEPAVAAPVVASGWEFSGNAVVYYQTNDSDLLAGNAGLFKQNSSQADAGVQLRAMNKDVAYGIGAGVEVSGLATLGLQHWMVSNTMQAVGSNGLQGGWMSQAYLTYGMGNTSIKAGRQELPMELSPFAYSEHWNVFANTFDAVLIVNSDLPQTTLVGAWVARNNINTNFGAAGLSIYLPSPLSQSMDSFTDTNHNDGVFMLTAQNKSIANLTLTGSYYFANRFLQNNYGIGGGDNTNIFWADAQYAASNFNVGLQGGTIHVGEGTTNTNVFGAKVGTTFSGINLGLAFSDVNNGTTGMFQVGGTTSALYTNTVANQVLGNALEHDSNKVVLSANGTVYGGTLSGAYAYTDAKSLPTMVLSPNFTLTTAAGTHKTNEFDVVYSKDVMTNLNLTAAYVYLDSDLLSEKDNIVRVVANYKF